MTPTLWAVLYVCFVLVVGSVLMGWTDGVWRRRADIRERTYFAAVEPWNERLRMPLPPRKPRTFKHRNLRIALQARAQREMGVR